MAFQELALAPAARLAVERELQSGRCDIDADSFAAPRPDPRARRDVPAPFKRSSGNSMLSPGACGEVLRPVMCLLSHRPYIELLYRAYSKRF